MTTFVLVHGAWHGGWCYKRVARLLRQAGHEVYTPTLTGLGERAHLMNRAIDLDTHVQDVAGVIRCEGLSEVVLCGHSYGGMVITGVAEQIAAKIALRQLDDRELKDLGIFRCQIDDVIERGRNRGCASRAASDGPTINRRMTAVGEPQKRGRSCREK